MNTENFIEDNFDVAFDIHEKCNELGLSVDNARLMVYIYLKVKDYNGDYSKFQNDKMAINVVEFLMNDKKLDFGPKVEKYFESLTKVPQKLNDLDGDFRNNLGMEFRIKSELINRYRLHTEKDFCYKKLKVYQDDIFPFIKKKEKK